MTSRRSWIVLYVGTLSVIAGVLFATAQLTVPEDATRFWNTLGTLIGLGLLAEAFSLQVRVPGATSAVSFVPYLASFLLLGPEWGMLVAGCCELTAETLIRRKPLIKVLHNTAKEIVAVFMGASIYVLLGGTVSFENFSVTIPAFLLSTLAYFVLTNGSTAIAITLSTKADFTDSWRSIVGRGIIQHDLMASSLSVLLGFLFIELQLLGVFLVIVPLFFVRHAHHVNLQLETTNRELLDLMVKSIEARDPYTSGHSVRVATYAKALARAVGASPKELVQIETAAVLHDVGKIFEEFAPLLRKSGKLTPDEFHLMHTHPIRSAELVGTISGLRGYVQNCVKHHHENYDGSGYPDGLVADEIPMGARIIMIADTADAMTSDRPYRQALSFDSLIAELDRRAGIQFDPELVSAFCNSAVLRRLIDQPRPHQELPVGDAQGRAVIAAG